MRYKILDTDNNKEYYRKRLPKKVKNTKNGTIFEVHETLKPIGYIINGRKTVVEEVRTQR